MKVSDYVIDFLTRQRIGHNFLISGGAVVHLVDSVARHPKMKYICNQHEQHCAAAADMYARVSRNLGVVLTTTGAPAPRILSWAYAMLFSIRYSSYALRGKFRSFVSKKENNCGYEINHALEIESSGNL